MVNYPKFRYQQSLKYPDTMFGLKKKNRAPAIDTRAGYSLADRLKRTRSGLFAGLFGGTEKHVNTAALENLEERMISADIGVKTTGQIIRSLKASAKKDPPEALIRKLKDTLLPLLLEVEKPLIVPAQSGKKPFLILVVGVNGVGKTTTIGKLAKRLQNEGRSIILAAADTFRAAAIEQLQVWGERNNIRVIAQSHGADSGAVVFDALGSAQANGVDVLIADTAGRLHNKERLMEEMKKIHRIGVKFDTDLQQEVLLVLDAGTGQNALVQARQFNEAIGIDGIVLTKLDSTAKGGIVFSLADELKIPIRFIGVGEQLDDLRPFNATDFVDALLSNDLEMTR